MTIARLEFPVVYIDDIVFDSLNLGAGANYIDVINRSPEPNEVSVRADLPIQFDLIAQVGAIPVLTETTVQIRVTSALGYVGPIVTMYDGSDTGAEFQPGFDGPLSDVFIVKPSSYRFIFDLTLDLDSESTVEIFVNSIEGTGIQFNESWSFTIEDVTAPSIESVIARNVQTIRVEFTEPVDQSSVTGLNSSTNPSNYSIEILSLPAVEVVVESVDVITDSSVDLTLDIEMSPNAEYRLIVSSVHDIFENEILAPFNQLDFVGFVPDIPDDRSFQLWDMIPQKNRDEDNGDGYKFISCLQEITDLLLYKIDTWTDILDPDIAPETFLDAMLDDLGNPFEFDLSVDEKRKLIRVLVNIYRQKGTAIGIINVVRFFLGIEIQIIEFSKDGWDLGIDELGDSSNEGTAELGPGTLAGLYSFSVVSSEVLTDEQREQITNIANYMKPGHTHLVSIDEPDTPTVIDHLELGLSVLGDEEWQLH